MMKNIWRYVLTGLILVWGMIFFPLSGIAADNQGKPVLILADVSGSMRDTFDADQDMTKVLALKELLLGLSRELPSAICNVGILRVRYISGDRNRYEPFLPVAAYEREKMIRQIREEFTTDYPVFNRRTPLADMLRQLDERELGKLDGGATLLLISDGRETFYDIEDDEKESRKAASDDKVRGPLTEISRLKERYGQNLTLHTVSMDRKDGEGGALLERMASVGEGKYFYGPDLLGNDSRMAELSALLCEKEDVAEPVVTVIKEAPVVAATPPPAPLAKAEEVPEGPSDSDGDGVYDDKDRCPGTPQAASVNIYGCWVLEGVLFAFDKWDIRSQYYPDLDAVVSILEQNPELRIEIQGHTDSFGTAAYNQKLSERRAESVRAYLAKKGIASHRLSTSGYGFDRPVVPNTTPENRQLNRRVELKPVR